MARINIEDTLWGDPRFQDLMIKVGRHAAKGMVVELWTLAQRFWIASGGKGIPRPAWDDFGLPQELIDCRLARDDGDFIYAIGSKEQFSWLNQRSEAGRENKGKSNERRRTEGKRKRTKSNEIDPLTLSLSLSPSLSQNSNSDSNSKKEENTNAGAFIATYCRVWKDRYEARPEITGKEQGIAKRLAKDLGTERASELVESYLRMQDAWFQQKRHDLGTFSQNLNAVVQFHETGKTVTRTQIGQTEKLSYAQDQLKRIADGSL